MHVENELTEIVTIGDHEFEEVIEEEVPEPPLMTEMTLCLPKASPDA